MKFLKQLIPVLCFAASLSAMDAQTLSRSVIATTGSDNTQLSYTVGESVIATGTSVDFILTQGFQQPDALVGTFVDPALGSLDFRLYPSPTLGDLMLETETSRPMQLNVSFTDARGRMVLPESHLRLQGASQHRFDVSSFATGTYTLILRLENGLPIRTIRFQKVD